MSLLPDFETRGADRTIAEFHLNLRFHNGGLYSRLEPNEVESTLFPKQYDFADDFLMQMKLSNQFAPRSLTGLNNTNLDPNELLTPEEQDMYADSISQDDDINEILSLEMILDMMDYFTTDHYAGRNFK
jgi:hypothetical protein